MAENKGYVHPEALVDANWVADHLNDPNVRLIEVDVDTSAYNQGHIRGAIGFNWQKELQDQVVRAPLSKEHLEDLLSRAGVNNDTTIILYGDNNNWFAAWAFWILNELPNYRAAGSRCSKVPAPVCRAPSLSSFWKVPVRTAMTRFRRRCS